MNVRRCNHSAQQQPASPLIGSAFVVRVGLRHHPIALGVYVGGGVYVAEEVGASVSLG